MCLFNFWFENIKTERNFENECTSMIIKPNKLKVVGLKYEDKEYSLIEVSLADFMKERFDGDSCIFNKTFS